MKIIIRDNMTASLENMKGATHEFAYRFCCSVLFLFSVLSLAPMSSAADNTTAIKNVLDETREYSCLSQKESALLTQLNEYRGSHGLPDIPNSRSLNKVARIHAMDLAENKTYTGKDSRGENCNLHSWSDRGFWTPVCYTRDHLYADQSRNKAQQITNNVYYDVAYENAYWVSAGEVTPLRVVEKWKTSPGHNALILELGTWKDVNFVAMGIGIYKNIAVIWVGSLYDPQGSMKACEVN